MIKLSKVSKLDGIFSWSLTARTDCPGSIDPRTGKLVPACDGCYAAENRGNFRFPNVKKVRVENRRDWKRDEWVRDMVQVLDTHRYFRWFDSGDIYHPRLAEKILEVCKATPWVKHWLPTRSHKIPRIAKVLRKIAKLDNVKVRYSSDAIDGTFKRGNGSTIVPSLSTRIDGVYICQASRNDGMCSGCRKCWDKNVSVVGYVAHGRAMEKIIVRQAA